jgi:pimeloyl-ACP methyl ester carboxylesterase
MSSAATRGTTHTTDGVRLYDEDHGTGMPILCIHGAGGTSLAWAEPVAFAKALITEVAGGRAWLAFPEEIRRLLQSNAPRARRRSAVDAPERAHSARRRRTPDRPGRA